MTRTRELWAVDGGYALQTQSTSILRLACGLLQALPFPIAVAAGALNTALFVNNFEAIEGKQLISFSADSMSIYI